MIESHVASQIIRSKAQLYEAMQFNQFVTPPPRDNLMTAEFMKGVLKGKYWMLKAENVTKFRVCAHPPKREVLATTAADLLKRHRPINPEEDKAMRRTAKLIELKKPCAKWCLLIIAQLDEDHFFFSKQHT